MNRLGVSKGSERLHILIISDSRPLLADVLTSAGHQVTHLYLPQWEDHAEAIQRKPPEAILVDWCLDGTVSGTAFIRTLRANGFSGKLFLVCPRLPEPQKRHRFVTKILGATGVIHIPIPNDALLRIMSAP